ncbi:MAG: PepSY domain-containing protein, partial [Nitrospira sp.]|nr:PepSY domain-containing protein [Nitrospira sp.]
HGKARDWNWHHAFGLWSTPFLVVMIVTAIPISFRWAGSLIDRTFATSSPSIATETRPPRPGSSPAHEDHHPPTRDALLQSVRNHVTDWDTITLRLAPPGRQRSQPGAASLPGQAGDPPRDSHQVTFAVRSTKPFPRFAQRQIVVDTITGRWIRNESYETQALTRKVRSWMRFLHTGEAVGLPGQIAAALASAAGVVLVWTGVALAFRRYSAQRHRGSTGSNP